MFRLHAAVEEKFGSFDETLAFVSEERRRIVRLPLAELWKSGARFQEDGSLGNGEAHFKFNRYGFRAICSLVGVSDEALQRLKAPHLIPGVLNDLLSTSLEREKSCVNAHLVCDDEDKTMIGVVSNKYVSYGNDAFLRDLMISLDQRNDGALFPRTGDFVFKEAYSINSRLFLRLNSRSIRGVVKGRGGRGDDVSEIGVEVSNSLAGGHAVKLAWFVFRLICANGLVAKVAGSQDRVFHSGGDPSFRRRLLSSASGLFQSLGKAKRMVETLANIPFSPKALARTADLKLLFSIIPGRNLKVEALNRIRSGGYEKIPNDERHASRLADAIEALPDCLGGAEALSVFRSVWRDGASMYDFINVFTEHAKTLPNDQKIEAQWRAGDLAFWIFENRRKFL